MQIVSFSGCAQAGKTTATDALAKWCVNNGFTPRRLSFAGPLKRAVESLGGIKGGKRDALYRKLCQDIGSCLRDPNYVPGITGPNYFVDLAADEIGKVSLEDIGQHTDHEKYHERVVIFDDARFMNEIGLLRASGAKLIFIDAGNRLPDAEAEWRKHESEQMCYDYMLGRLPDETFHYALSNTGIESDFRALIDRMAPTWLGVVAGEYLR